MLVLSRKPGESLVINGNIRIRVLSVNKQGIRLGICAPDAVVVDREEVARKRQELVAKQQPEKEFLAECI